MVAIFRPFQFFFIFFFSSRRRHTRWPHDWSSDVCSSDLIFLAGIWRVEGTLPVPVRLPLRLDPIEGIRFAALVHAKELDRIYRITGLVFYGAASNSNPVNPVDRKSVV